MNHAAVLALALATTACTMDIENRHAAQQLSRESHPAGSVYLGWRVFQDRCASCHGVDANGTANAPNLLPRVRDMSSREFVTTVLKRYEWNLPGAQTAQPDNTRDTLIEGQLSRQGPAVTMPAWGQEPRVNAHIMDLYAYLSARADGTQAPGRPLP